MSLFLRWNLTTQFNRTHIYIHLMIYITQQDTTNKQIRTATTTGSDQCSNHSSTPTRPHHKSSTPNKTTTDEIKNLEADTVMTLFAIGHDLHDEVASTNNGHSNTEIDTENLKRPIDDVGSDDDSEYSEEFSGSEEHCVSDDELVEESVNEIEERHKVSSAVDDYGAESLIFAEADLEA